MAPPQTNPPFSSLPLRHRGRATCSVLPTWETSKSEKVEVLVAQLCSTLCDPMDCSPPGFSVHRIVQARILGVGCHSLLQGIFLTQGSNLSCLHCRQILHCLSHQGRPSEVTLIPGQTPWLLSSFSSPGTCCQFQPPHSLDRQA